MVEDINIAITNIKKDLIVPKVAIKIVTSVI